MKPEWVKSCTTLHCLMMMDDWHSNCIQVFFAAGVTIKAAHYSSTLKMEAEDSSETFVNFYQTTRRHIPEDNYLPSHWCESLKSHKDMLSIIQNTPWSINIGTGQGLINMQVWFAWISWFHTCQPSKIIQKLYNSSAKITLKTHSKTAKFFGITLYKTQHTS
jgi:hypothetical protein